MAHGTLTILAAFFWKSLVCWQHRAGNLLPGFRARLTMFGQRLYLVLQLLLWYAGIFYAESQCFVIVFTRNFPAWKTWLYCWKVRSSHCTRMRIFLCSALRFDLGLVVLCEL